MLEEKNNPLISIVIPTYNCENYITETLANVLLSEYKNFEIICVDDLSTDNTVSIIENYVKSDKRIKLIPLKEKGGNPAKSIIFAMPFCKGEYFFYMSHDDLISADCLSNCIEAAIKTEADIVVPNMVWYFSKRQSNEDGIYPKNVYGKSELNGSEAFVGVCSYKLHGFSLKKISLMKKYPYDAKLIDSTDIITTKQYYFANKVVLCNGIFFYRQDNSNALTKKFNIKFLEMLDGRIDLINFAIKHNIKDLKAVSDFYFRILKVIYKKIKNLNYIEKDFKKQLKKSLASFRKIMLSSNLYSYFFLSIYFQLKFTIRIIKINLKGVKK